MLQKSALRAEDSWCCKAKLHLRRDDAHDTVQRRALPVIRLAHQVARLRSQKQEEFGSVRHDGADRHVLRLGISGSISTLVRSFVMTLEVL